VRAIIATIGNKFLSRQMQIHAMFSCRHRMWKRRSVRTIEAIVRPFDSRSRDIPWKYLFHRLLDHFYSSCSNARRDVRDATTHLTSRAAGAINSTLMENFSQNLTEANPSFSLSLSLCVCAASSLPRYHAHLGRIRFGKKECYDRSKDFALDRIWISDLSSIILQLLTIMSLEQPERHHFARAKCCVTATPHENGRRVSG